MKPRIHKIKPKGVYSPASFSVNRKLGAKLRLGFKKNKGLGKIKI